jgi:hypothetical protein
VPYLDKAFKRIFRQQRNHRIAENYKLCKNTRFWRENLKNRPILLVPGHISTISSASSVQIDALRLYGFGLLI